MKVPNFKFLSVFMYYTFLYKFIKLHVIWLTKVNMFSCLWQDTVLIIHIYSN